MGTCEKRKRAKRIILAREGEEGGEAKKREENGSRREEEDQEEFEKLERKKSVFEDRWAEASRENKLYLQQVCILIYNFTV